MEIIIFLVFAIIMYGWFSYYEIKIGRLEEELEEHKLALRGCKRCKARFDKAEGRKLF